MHDSEQRIVTASGGTLPEPWLRGPVRGVHALLQPAAHALLQAKEDVRRASESLSPAELWARPGGVASVGFHLRHIPGSIDRLLTYASGALLDEQQLAALEREQESGTPPSDAESLLGNVDRAIDGAIDTLRAADAARLLEARTVGRSRLPSTVIGLLFHVAEHTQRHSGQAVATARVVRWLARDRSAQVSARV